MKTSIYIAQHKECVTLKGDNFIPIHVGRRGRPATFCEAGDDTGDHISHKNDTFCELSALYWVWKNTQGQDYVGFLHYRRHLNFSNTEHQEDQWGLIPYETINEQYIAENKLTDAGVNSFLNGFDIILPKQWDVKNAGSSSLEDHYRNAPHQHISDYEMALRVIRDIYPDYGQYIKEVSNGSKAYFTNIFVMRRDIFDHYCNWLFKILFELEDRVDISGYSVQERRIFGFISEWLLNIFIKKLIADRPELRIKETQRTFVMDTSPAIEKPISEFDRPSELSHILRSLKYAPRDMIRYAKTKIRGNV